ncbi:hypothetical protein BDV98DRAFT_574726 [Pterulicium gracile]|uniref:Uncharacterized protein n=1 Tax=Pterulicium gracile TaxID=1884261 RepID=A0A5C3Q741_9AGAR|nr:hypothetical protein BDV98DRAFT_574726 [Pterula gracilis]
MWAKRHRGHSLATPRRWRCRCLLMVKWLRAVMKGRCWSPQLEGMEERFCLGGWAGRSGRKFGGMARL